MQTANEILLQRLPTYLLGGRGLGTGSARGDVDLVAGFVEHCMRDDEDHGDLTAAELTAFVVRESRRLSPTTLQRRASALRALLRWWHLQGRDHDLPATTRCTSRRHSSRSGCAEVGVEWLIVALASNKQVQMVDADVRIMQPPPRVLSWPR